MLTFAVSVIKISDLKTISHLMICLLITLGVGVGPPPSSPLSLLLHLNFSLLQLFSFSSFCPPSLSFFEQVVKAREIITPSRHLSYSNH